MKLHADKQQADGRYHTAFTIRHYSSLTLTNISRAPLLIPHLKCQCSCLVNVVSEDNYYNNTRDFKRVTLYSRCFIVVRSSVSEFLIYYIFELNSTLKTESEMAPSPSARTSKKKDVPKKVDQSTKMKKDVPKKSGQSTSAKKNVPKKLGKNVAPMKSKATSGGKQLPLHQMIISVVVDEKPAKREGMNARTIKKHLMEKYGVEDAKLGVRFKKSLMKAVESNAIVCTKGSGANGYYKVAKSLLKENAKRVRKNESTKISKAKTSKSKSTQNVDKKKKSKAAVPKPRKAQSAKPKSTAAPSKAKTSKPVKT